MNLYKCPKYFFWLFTSCKNSPSFKIILNRVTKPVDLPECPKYLSDYPQVVKISTGFRMILNKVAKLVNLPECPKYFFWLSTSCNNSPSYKMILNRVSKFVNVPDCPKYFSDSSKTILQASEWIWIKLQSLWTFPISYNMFYTLREWKKRGYLS